ncbi:MAG: hypothetical protein AAGJ29_04505 [Pseudomonadota bacterium]
MICSGVIPASRLLPDKAAAKNRQQAMSAFPFGLGLSGVHELAEGNHGDFPALSGFALAASQTLPAGPLLWVSQWALGQEHGAVRQDVLEVFHARARPCLFVRPRKLMDALWTVEEGIASGAVSCVVAEVCEADFTATRRLALAASRQKVPVLLLMPRTREGATAATARWRISAALSGRHSLDPRAPGRPRWHAVLEKSRNAPAFAGHEFDVEFDYETLSLHLVSRLVTRSAEAHWPERGHPDLRATG